jgi:hypothetical protein
MSTIGPLPEPVAGCKAAAPPVLTADQQTKYEQLLTEVKSWESLPTTKAETENKAVSDDERLWLTRECLLRYLRATKWNLAQAIQRLKATLIWRREFGTDTLTADYISPENEKGKQVQLGFDKEGRPCLYLLPQNQNTKPSQRQVEHLVYMLERTLDLHPPGQEGLALLIDFRNTGAGGTPSMGIAKQVLDILQSHYPERLGRALLTHCMTTEISVLISNKTDLLYSALVCLNLPQAHRPLHRPRHQVEDQVQRAAGRPRPRLAAHGRIRWRDRFQVRPQHLLARARQDGCRAETTTQGAMGEGWQADWRERSISVGRRGG